MQITILFWNSLMQGKEAIGKEAIGIQIQGVRRQERGVRRTYWPLVCPVHLIFLTQFLYRNYGNRLFERDGEATIIVRF